MSWLPERQGPFEAVAGGLRVAVRVTPRASRAAIDGVAVEADGRPVLRLRVAAPPVDGAANAAVVRLLSRRWRVPASRITVVSGAAARRKTVLIAGDGAALLKMILGGEHPDVAGR